MKQLLFKKTNGQPSWSLTFAVVAFAATTLWYVLSIATNLGPIHIRPFVGADAMLYLAPVLAQYFGSKINDPKAVLNNVKGEDQEP